MKNKQLREMIVQSIVEQEKPIKSDIHKIIASRIFNISYNRINKQQRTAAKEIFFRMLTPKNRFKYHPTYAINCMFL